MKRILTLFAAALAVVGCSHDEVVTPNIPTEKPTYYATFADAEGESRTYLDEHLKLLWHNDDRISLFQTTYNEEYAFADPTGSNSGAFNAVESGNWVTGNQPSTTYAVYPYNAANALSNSEVLTIHFAAEQTYAEDSFGRGANTMVAATATATSKLLPFRNAGGYLMLKLYGENKTVKSIELKGNNDEVISGAATAEAKYGYLPSITMGAEGGKTITLTCEEAVTLGATEEEATVFWLVVPPVTFEKGFTITVTDANGGTYTKSTSKSTTIERNTVKSMAALNPIFEPIPNNEIHYTSIERITPYKTDVFGATYLASQSTYDRTTQKGVLKFGGAVMKIGDYAFSDCLLISVAIPNSVTEIGERAFEGCYGLASVTIPDSVKTIGRFAFNYCEALTSVTISDSVTTIGDHAFANCNALTSVTIGNSVTTIGGYAFWNCKSLTSVIIPESVTTIEHSLFYNCFSLASVTIPNGVTTIGATAFYGCSSLTSVTIPDSVTTIGWHTFDSCSSLTSVTIPDGVTTIESGVFSGCDALKEFKGKSASRDGRCLIVDGVLNSFAPAELTSYAVPNGVTTIGESAFSSCDALTSVTIPNSVTTIGSDAFSKCSSLTSVTIGSNVTTIGGSAFWACTSLTSVTIPEGVTTIGGNAFLACTSLTSVTIPEGVTTIGGRTFENCRALTSVAIPNSVTTIGSNAFDSCSSLISVTIPDGVTTIESGVFSGCDALKEFKGKFASNDGRCLIVDGVLNSFAPAGLISYTIPDSVTTIGDHAFASCNALTSVTIGDNVARIRWGAYRECSSLTSVTIGNSMRTIENSAFANCPSLATVYCKAATPPILGYYEVFYKNASDRKIYVPASEDDSVITAYQNAWRNYADAIVEYDFSAEQ